jgi:hypothetical protein
MVEIDRGLNNYGTALFASSEECRLVGEEGYPDEPAPLQVRAVVHSLICDGSVLYCATCTLMDALPDA